MKTAEKVYDKHKALSVTIILIYCFYCSYQKAKGQKEYTDKEAEKDSEEIQKAVNGEAT